MHRARTEISNLKVQRSPLPRLSHTLVSKTKILPRLMLIFKQSLRKPNHIANVQNKKRFEEFRKQIVSKDRDMACKDAEIAELTRRLLESQDKTEYFKVDLEAEKKRVDGVVEAHDISQAALNVAQDNDAEIQSTIEALEVGVVATIWDHACKSLLLSVANAVLNSIELNQTVMALTVAVRHKGHHEGYTECVPHVEVALHVKWDNSHCSTSAEVETVYEKA
ncbi:hypothetical protein Hanom_Chr16g01464771 [Helianthus anomalus]